MFLKSTVPEEYCLWSIPKSMKTKNTIYTTYSLCDIHDDTPKTTTQVLHFLFTFLQLQNTLI